MAVTGSLLILIAETSCCVLIFFGFPLIFVLLS